MKLIIFIVSLFSISVAGYAQSLNQNSENKEILLNDRILSFEGPKPVFISVQNNRSSERIKFDAIEPTFIQRKTNTSLPEERPVFQGPEAVIIQSEINNNSKQNK